eukprot:1614594-Pyramimonas_sp.AAC.1
MEAASDATSSNCAWAERAWSWSLAMASRLASALRSSPLICCVSSWIWTGSGFWPICWTAAARARPPSPGASSPPGPR